MGTCTGKKPTLTGSSENCILSGATQQGSPLGVMDGVGLRLPDQKAGCTKKAEHRRPAQVRGTPLQIQESYSCSQSRVPVGKARWAVHKEEQEGGKRGEGGRRGRAGGGSWESREGGRKEGERRLWMKREEKGVEGRGGVKRGGEGKGQGGERRGRSEAPNRQSAV